MGYAYGVLYFVGLIYGRISCCQLLLFSAFTPLIMRSELVLFFVLLQLFSSQPYVSAIAVLVFYAGFEWFYFCFVAFHRARCVGSLELVLRVFGLLILDLRSLRNSVWTSCACLSALRCLL